MLFGVVDLVGQTEIRIEDVRSACEVTGAGADIVSIQPQRSVVLANIPLLKSGTYQNLKPAVYEDGSVSVVFSGQIYNKEELAGSSTETGPGSNLAKLVLALYKKHGQGFVNAINGKFAVAVWDRNRGELLLARDRFGIEPLYYQIDNNRIVFSSAIAPILRYRKLGGDLNFASVSKFLLFGYNPSLDTFYKNIYKLRPAHTMRVGRNGTPDVSRYWKLDYSEVLESDEKRIGEELRELLRTCVARRMDDEPYGVFVSGGMDSSSVLGFASQLRDMQPRTFSYRCKGESFDESPYARLMAESTNSIHDEIEYSPEDVLCMSDITAGMDEPFCDVGINIATYILGKAAEGAVPYVLTGDGGDELFASHPVYEADKIARFVDPVPGLIKKPLFSLARLLPDSDQKKNLTVKLKRFAESMAYPPELLSHRWRIYYQPSDLKALLSDDAWDSIKNVDLYKDMTDRNAEIRDVSFLNRSLYSDYNTVMDFYLRRNDINRRFGVETRYPMLDHELVEFCAKIPLSLKIRGWFDTKYIFRMAMEPVLPHRIVHRTDKLGHSIPLKNWLRDKQVVKEFVLDHLSEEAVRKRGFFNSNTIKTMVDEHMSKQRNNSHRLWTLAVLEMWLRQHVDKALP